MSSSITGQYPHTGYNPHWRRASDGGLPPSPWALRNQAALWLFKAMEVLVCIWLILHFSGGVIVLVLSDPSNPGAESDFVRMLWYPSYLMIMGLTVVNFKRVVRMAVFNPLIVTAVLICGVSYLWSIDPSLTMRRSIAILMTTLFGLVLAARFTWPQLVKLIAAAYIGLAILSLMFGVLLGTKYGIHQDLHGGAWRGVWTEKNLMGAHMVRGLLLMLCAWAISPRQFMIWLPAAALCLLLVLLSTSKTSLLGALLVISSFTFIRIFRRYFALRVPLVFLTVTLVGVFAALLIFIPDEMFALIGKERTLTGRTDIWDELIRSIKDKPWLGYGYGAYWDNPLGPSYMLRANLEWGVPTAHNGWMETWLSTGLLNVALFALTFVLALALALTRFVKGGVESYWVLPFLLIFLLFSMSESTILQQNDISWVVFVATAAKLFALDPAFRRTRDRQRLLATPLAQAR